jgi:hypothetical protein
MSQVTGIAWLSDTRLISVGNDSHVKLWTIEGANSRQA